MDILTALDGLPVRDFEQLKRLLGNLTPEEQVFVQEFVATLDRRTAAEAAGQHPKMGNRYLTERRWTHVALAVEEALKGREAVSELKAEYVRRYLLDVLELCPTDHFTVGPDGRWMVTPEQFKELPHAVKRLVERVEMRYYGGQFLVSVEFVSKEVALKMAAAATIGMKVAVSSPIPWEQIAGADLDGGAKAVEDRIKQLTVVPQEAVA